MKLKILRLYKGESVALIVSFLFSYLPALATNNLAIGNANSPAVNIPLNEPGDLNYRTKSDILSARVKLVERFPGLLASPYTPSNIFDAIEDNRPWWGMHGAFIWGPGQRSIEGAAEESRFLMNPYLLVGANSGTCLIWDTDKITDFDLNDRSFPYCWLPQSLYFYPAQGLMQATYNVSNFNQQLANHGGLLTVPVSDTIKFGLIAYNAADFGYKYIYLDLSKSLNITAPMKIDRPVLIKQIIHCGGTCQIPGGCNNMSPAQPEIDEFHCTALPARANIRLWKEQPANKDIRPDLSVYLDFR